MDSFDILNHLECYSIKEGKPLIEELIEDEETKFSIEKAIEREISVHKIAEYLKNIVHEGYGELAIKFVKSYIDNTLLSKIEINCVPHNDVWEIGLYVGIIAIGGKEVQAKLFDVVSPQIEKEENVGKIGTFVIWIRDAWVDWDPATELARKLVNHNIDTLFSKIEKEEDLEKICLCIWRMATVSETLGMALVDSVPSKIEKVEDLDVLSSYLATIEYVSEALAQKFVNRLNPKLREELQKRGW
jgi:hypothetical protein